MSWAQYEVTCPICRTEAPIERRRLTFDDFVRTLTQMHVDDTHAVVHIVSPQLTQVDAERRQLRAAYARRRRIIRNNPRLLNLDQRARTESANERASRRALDVAWNRRIHECARHLWSNDAVITQLRRHYVTCRSRRARYSRMLEHELNDASRHAR